MKQCSNKSGFTLSELLVVMAVMMVLAVMTVPATKALMKSFETSAGVRTVISAALCNARAIAATGSPAGVRFQQDLKGNQYMIFIIHDPAPAPTAAELAAKPFATGTGLAYGFRAIEGKKPIKLPANIGVMDLHTRLNLVVPMDPADQGIAADGDIDDVAEVMDATTFSIVFSKVGKLIVHEVRVRNRTGNTSADDVFDIDLNVDAGDAMFYQDDYANLGLGQERSRKWFVVYDKKAFDAVSAGRRWSDYLEYLKNNETVYVNPRTGEVINY